MGLGSGRGSAFNKVDDEWVRGRGELAEVGRSEVGKLLLWLHRDALDLTLFF